MRGSVAYRGACRSLKEYYVGIDVEFAAAVTRVRGGEDVLTEAWLGGCEEEYTGRLKIGKLVLSNTSILHEFSRCFIWFKGHIDKISTLLTRKTLFKTSLILSVALENSRIENTVFLNEDSSFASRMRV